MLGAGEGVGTEVGVPAGFEGIISTLGDLGWVGIAILAIWAFATDKLYTRGQVERLLASKEEVIAVWKESSQHGTEALKGILSELEPIAAGNAAVLKAVETIQSAQAEQDRMRRRGSRD